MDSDSKQRELGIVERCNAEAARDENIGRPVIRLRRSNGTGIRGQPDYQIAPARVESSLNETLSLRRPYKFERHPEVTGNHFSQAIFETLPGTVRERQVIGIGANTQRGRSRDRKP